MARFTSLRMRLVATVFIAIAPVLAIIYFTDLGEWSAFLVGLGSLVAAWYGGERYVLRQVRGLLDATKKLAEGDLTSRTGLSKSDGEMGELARTFDMMAEKLEQRARESEQAETNLLNRALQQTAVAALGQFALTGNDLNALLQQAVVLVSQTLDVEFCDVLELSRQGDHLILRAGTGWSDGCVGHATLSAERNGQHGFTLFSGEPVIVQDFRTEKRFQKTQLLEQHGIVCGATVAISTRQLPYGVLGVHTTQPRVFTGDEVHFLMSVATSLGMAVERNRAEANLQKLAVFAQLNPNPAMELAADGTVTYFNDAALKLALSVGKDHPRDVMPEQLTNIVTECLASGHSNSNLETKAGQRTFLWSFHPVGLSGVVHCYVEDITARLNLEEQLRQSQKMESVGQLAAGVAHDFNNMLTIIQGHAGMLMARASGTPEKMDSAQAIYFASERAAALTRQLLMFSRRNVMQVGPLDLRQVLGNMTKMLKRLLGETVTLEFNPPSDLPAVKADSGMLEQVIMNLCVNARDAMPKGGRLTVSLGPVQVNEEYAQGHPEARIGHFICLRVEDTGIGMDSATVSRIFEPFFTTKDVGKGTGLGLATVYGIVKQHEGWIEVSSEVGKGSRFTVFLPAAEGKAVTGKTDSDPAAFVRGGDETILIVEDEPVLREMANTILKDCGYTILEAGSGKEALELWRKRATEIDLLVTDIVMPEGVSGVELAESIRASQADLKVVFTSGYTMDDVNTAYLERTRAHFLQKPYTRTTLARAVRVALDREAPAQTVTDTSHLHRARVP